MCFPLTSPCREFVSVSSVSLIRWNTSAKARLDEVAQAHEAVGGSRPGRRAATLQINRAYAMLLSSHFQGYCRDLHSEATDHLCAHLTDPWARPILRARLAEGRKLDLGTGRVVLRLSDVKGWRAACTGLSITLDEVVGGHIRALGSTAPW